MGQVIKCQTKLHSWRVPVTFFITSVFIFFNDIISLEKDRWQREQNAKHSKICCYYSELETVVYC